MSNDKWWQDNDRYIPNPWDEITRLRNELNQMQITESALRESLTGLLRESNEYRHKIETENAALRAENAKVMALVAVRRHTWEAYQSENAALRELINEPYQFFSFGHRALEPWKKALDGWCERAEQLGFKKEAKP